MHGKCILKKGKISWLIASISSYTLMFAWLWVLQLNISYSYGQETERLPEELKNKLPADFIKLLAADSLNTQYGNATISQQDISFLKENNSISDTVKTQILMDQSQSIVSEINQSLQDTLTDISEEYVYTGEGRFQGLIYFGYDIFKNKSDTMGPIEIGPVDPGYPVGAGDVLRLTVWGEVQFQYELVIEREGTIVIPKVGQLFIAGTRLEQLQQKLHNYLSKYYSGLKNDPPTTFMDVTLARLRNNQIYVMGEINQPGAYSISSYATAFNALYATGGLKTLASFRDIHILREGKIIARIDLYDYLLKGHSTEDIRLQNSDILFVPPRLTTIGIKGEILRPGIYELTTSENLKDLVEMAGGLKPSAYIYRVQIDRIRPFELRQKGDNARELIDIDINNIFNTNEAIPIYNGDIVTIFTIIDDINIYVDLSGAGIFRPGRYELNANIVTISDLIHEADGLKGDAYLKRADLIRTRDDYTKQFIQINLEAALNKDPREDIELKRWDEIYIYSQQEMIEQSVVTLNGYVTNPGTYPLPDNMYLYDLLFKYSGLQDSLRVAKTFMERGDIFRRREESITRYIMSFNLSEIWNNTSTSKYLLQPDDEIMIYERSVIEMSSKTVHLNGAVKKPDVYEWKDNMSLPDLIIEGGGFTEGAWIYEAEVARFPLKGIPGDTTAVIINVPLFDQQRAQEDIEKINALILTGNTSGASFTLLPNDNIFIRYNPEFKLSKTVTVKGELKKPGIYVLEKQNEKLSDIIRRAGGLKSTAYAGGGQLFRGDERVYVDFEKIIDKKSSKEDIILHSNDKIIIPQKPNSVLVYGEVVNPGYYKFIPKEKAKDYLNNSGGRTENGGKVFVQEPSGKLKEVTFFRNPSIKDGSIIRVNPKPIKIEKEGTDWSETIKGTFAIMSSALMIIYLAEQIK